MVTFVNRAKMSVSSTGTGTLTLDVAVEGYQTFADAGVGNGDVVRYVIEDGNNWEIGTGLYTSTGTTLSRTVSESSNAGAEISVTLNAFVYVAAAAEDILQPAGGTMTGALILNAAPTVELQAATKGYVDTIAAAGLHYHVPVRAESPAPSLSVTYNNGTSGVGATLTNAGTQAALVLDGVTLDVDDRVLIYEQTDATQNGVYVVTDIGSGSTNWVLTRAADADSYAPSSPDSLGQGDAFFVLEGNTAAGELYVCNTEGTITFGTTNITFVQVAATAVYSAGTGLDLTGTVFSIDNTVVTADGTQTLTNKTLSNLAVSGDLSFPDNSKAIFGAGSDLTVYHDGTDSFVQDQGTGDLRLQTNGAKVNIYNSANSQVMAHFNTAGSVDLYYNGSQKLATTNTGIDVTGTVVADGLTVDGVGVISANSASDALRITQTGAGNAILVEDSANPDSTPFVVTSTGNVGIGTNAPTTRLAVSGGALRIDAGDAIEDALLIGAGTSGTTGEIRSVKIFANSSTVKGIQLRAENATQRIVSMNGGGLGQLAFGNSSDGGTTFNERMRINSAGNVGIGTVSPAQALDVVGAIQASTFFQGATDGTASAPLYRLNDANTGFFRPANNEIGFTTDGTERMRIDDSGNVGIGTTSPTSKLDVAGTVTGTALYSTSGFVENSQTVSADYTLVATRNAMSAGPIEVASGVTVTIETGARWVVI